MKGPHFLPVYFHNLYLWNLQEKDKQSKLLATQQDLDEEGDEPPVSKRAADILATAASRKGLASRSSTDDGSFFLKTFFFNFKIKIKPSYKFKFITINSIFKTKYRMSIIKGCFNFYEYWNVCEWEIIYINILIFVESFGK